MNKKYKKIAVMGGAYGNLPALKSCYADAVKNGCDGYFFLGDAIGFAGHSDETIDFIFTHFDIFLAGNLETQAYNEAESCACGYGAAEDEITGCKAFQYSLQSLSETNKERLGKLPEQAIIETNAGNVLLCHGSPAKQNEFLYESELDDFRIRSWLDELNITGFACTHTGLPWIRQYADGRFAVNCGATGKPDNDGDTCAHYALIDFSNKTTIDIRAVSYNQMQFAETLRSKGVEEIFVTPLETGIWACGVKSLPQAEREKIFLASKK